MPILSSEKLKEQITSIPSELQKAFEVQAKARMSVAHLEAQVDKLESEIERVSVQEDENDDVPEYDDLEDNLELLRLESTIERLKLKVTQAEDRAEIEFRKSTEKTTDALAKAAVGTNPKVIELKNELIDAKDKSNERRIILQNEKLKAREAKREAIHSARENTPAESGKLFELQEKLSEAEDALILAEDALILADNEVKVTYAKIETYKMLVKLEDRA